MSNSNGAGQIHRPHSRAAETKFLGTVILAGDREMLARVDEDAMFLECSRLLYDKLRALGGRIDVASVLEAVKDHKELGPFAGEVIDAGAHPPYDPSEFIAEINRCRDRRAFQDASIEAAAFAGEPGVDLAHVAAAHITRVEKIVADVKAVPGAAAGPSARARSWKELKVATFPTTEKLLGPLRRTEVGMLTAKTNVGKTTIALNFTASVCTGQAFGKILPGGKARKVLYVDAETPPGVFRADVSRMAESLEGSGAEELLDENLHTVLMDTLIDGEPLCLSNKKHLEWLEAEAVRVEADVIVLDTLVSLFELWNENDNAEIQRRVIKPARAMAVRLEVAVLINHHEGKGDQSQRETSDRPRGGSALTGGARMHWTLRRDPRNGKQVILSLGKVKGDEEGEVVLAYDHAARWYSPTDVKAPERPLSLAEQVVRAVTCEMTLAGIIALFPDYKSSTVEGHLQDAARRGELAKPKHGWYGPADSEPTKPAKPETGNPGFTGNGKEEAGEAGRPNSGAEAKMPVSKDAKRTCGKAGEPNPKAGIPGLPKGTGNTGFGP